MYKQIKQNKQFIKYHTRLILVMFIWILSLTGYIINDFIQQQKELINQTIINQEGIPLENISIDEFEVIGD